MRRVLLTGCAAAALSLIGAAAQAETIYMNNGTEILTTDSAYSYPTEPAYTYSVPGPLPFSRFIVTEPAPVVVAEPPAIVATAPAIVERPAVIAAPPRRVITHPRRTRAAVVTAPPAAVVTARAPVAVVARPVAVAPPVDLAPPVAVVPEDSGIVTTGYSTVRSCFTDLVGVERCY